MPGAELFPFLLRSMGIKGFHRTRTSNQQAGSAFTLKYSIGLQRPSPSSAVHKAKSSGVGMFPLQGLSLKSGRFIMNRLQSAPLTCQLYNLGIE